MFSKKNIIIALSVALFIGAILFFMLNARNIKSDLSESLRGMLAACPSSGDNQALLECTRPFIKKMVADHGVSDSLLALEVNANSSDFKIDCHLFAHILGEESVALSSLGNTLKSCTSICGFGCPHGAFSYELRRNPGIIYNISEVCMEVSKVDYPGQDRTACFHAAGHGLADVAGREISSALSLCDNIKDMRGREECASGVFMEIIDAPTFAAPQLRLPENLINFCGTLPSGYNNMCLTRMGGFEYRRSGDFKKAFSWCRNLSADLNKNCTFSIGADVHFTFYANTDKIWNTCDLYAGAGKLDCVQGALFSGLVNDPSGEKGLELCGKVEPGLRPGCLRWLGENIQKLHNQEYRTHLCSSLADTNDQLHCLE